MKKCYKCKKTKPLSMFIQFKSGVNKGYYLSYCNQCEKVLKKIHRRKQMKKYPWRKTYSRIITRCRYDKKHGYYKKGIKCLITIEELKFIWYRDKAYLMKRPSIDRKDSKKNYTLENCRYLELKENITRERCRGFILKGRWALKYDKCVDCGKSDIPHYALGKCIKCYGKLKWKRRKKKQEKIK